jgi:ribosomal protein S18 acetylase RimI-like enzyme
MGSSVQIVPYNPALHAAGLLRLYEEAFVAPVGAATGVNNAASSALEQVRTSSGFVGIAAGVGVVAGISVFDHPSRQDTCIIANLVTDVRYRRRGIASSLLREVIRAAKQRRLANLALQVDATNEAAIGLYQSVGFERVGEVAYFALERAALPEANSSNLCPIRRATAGDAAMLAQLANINIPSAMALAEPDIDRAEGAKDFWVGEVQGMSCALRCVQANVTQELTLLLNPKVSLASGQLFLRNALLLVAQTSEAKIVAKQSSHALVSVRVLQTCSFLEWRRMFHWKLDLLVAL